MQLPRTTGQAARLLDTTEPRLNDLVRRRKIEPAPPVVSGRRLWGPNHLRQAAASLGIHSPDLERLITETRPVTGRERPAGDS